MEKCCRIIVLLLALNVYGSEASLWPMPQSYVSQETTYSVNAESFTFSVVQEAIFSCSILDEAFQRYSPLIFGRRPETLYFNHQYRAAAGDISELVVKLGKPCSDTDSPSLESNESYTLTVSNAQVMLTAPQVWGILRGLETFSQLVYKTNDGEFLVNSTTINDYPRFAHRGVMLDTSRHFVSMKTLFENLDAMAQNKFNVFHWHIVDDPSFPYQSINFPTLSQKGAYDPETHIYTQSNVQSVIEYARKRGIRVVPEFDSPGHTQSWGKGVPNLLTKCYTGSQPNGLFGPIDPSNNASFTFLSHFFMEIAGVFPDKYLHLGGDEVSFTCWESNPDVQAFVKQQGYTSYSQVEQYYVQRVLDIVSGLNKGYQIWQEVIDNGAKVRPDTVVEVWKGGWQAEMSKVTQMGYKTLLATCWYLNYIKYGADWTSFYDCEPLNFTGTAQQKQLVEGGETCMWGEYVDSTNLISRLWPRAAAVGERLWSAQSLTDVNSARPRLVEHRCRMVSRGFRAEPITGPGFCRDEFSRG